MTIEDELGKPGTLGAWDDDDVNGETFVVYDVGDGGAHERSRSTVPAAERPALVARLEARGITTGRCNRWCSFVWVRDARGLTLWNSTSRILYATSSSVEAGGTRHMVFQLARVESFVHAEIIADHGVRLVDRAGTRIVLAAYVPTEVRPAWDPFMSGWAEEQLMGAFDWATWLARDLAATLGLPYEHVEPS